jgi:tetratricopeptide (TPR) repeat protein
MTLSRIALPARTPVTSLLLSLLAVAGLLIATGCAGGPQQGTLAEMITQLESELRETPGTLHTRQALALARMQNGDVTGAIQVLDEGLNGPNPNEPELLALKGHCFYTLGLSKPALEMVDRALGAQPGTPNPLLVFQRGLFRLAQRDHDGAVTDFESVVTARDPRLDERAAQGVYTEYATAQYCLVLKTGGTAADASIIASDVLRRGVERFTELKNRSTEGNARAQFASAASSMQALSCSYILLSEDYPAAITTLTEMLGTINDRAVRYFLHYNLGYAHLLSGDVDKARASVEACAESTPEIQLHRALRLRVAAVSGDEATVAEMLKDAKDIPFGLPKTTEALNAFVLGEMHFTVRSFERARDCFAKVEELEPGQLLSKYYWAMSSWHVGDIAGSLAALQSIDSPKVAAMPAFSIAVANAYLHSGQFAKAVESYQRVLQLDANNRAAKQFLAAIDFMKPYIAAAPTPEPEPTPTPAPVDPAPAPAPAPGN